MRKKFVAKSNKKRKIFQIISFLLILIISLTVTFNLLIKLKIKTLENPEIGKNLFTYGTNQSNIIDFDLLNPSKMLKIGLNYWLDIKENSSNYDVDILKNYVNDTKPTVYIYNSHETECYDSSLAEAYNIKYNVKIASYILSDNLKNLGITSYVEPESISAYMKSNNLSYKDSYVASKYFIEKRLKENPSIEIIIDLHRDSVARNISTATIENTNYARAMFVVGMDYEDYEYNLSYAEKINSHLDSRMSRGILKKTGSGVNGVYNQDMKKGSLLIELGGIDNTIEEVANTLEYIAKSIFEIREEQKYGKKEEN